MVSAQQLLDDYLFIGPLLVQRLQEQLGADMPVEEVEDLQTAGESERRAHVVWVLWAGDQFGDQAMGGAGQAIAQRWLVVLFIRNESIGDRAARRRSAGAWLGRIQRALGGFKPSGCVRGLRRAQGPAPNYTRAEGMFPLLFAIDLNL